MWATSKNKGFRFKASLEVYLLVTEIGLNSPILTLEETIRMVMHYYEQRKGKIEVQPSWNGKIGKGFEPKTKGVCLPIFSIIIFGKSQQGQCVTEQRNLKVSLDGNPREPLQCQGCGKNHRFKYLPCKRDNSRSLYNLVTIAIVEDMSR